MMVVLYRMISIWRFKSAPRALRALYRGTGEPDWVMQVPLSLADDLKKDFAAGWQEYSYKGMKVYFGTALSLGLLAPAVVEQRQSDVAGE